MFRSLMKEEKFMKMLITSAGFVACALVFAVSSTVLPSPAHASGKCDSIVQRFDPSSFIPSGAKICVDNAEGWRRCGGSSNYYRRVIGGNRQQGIERTYDCVKK